MFDMAESSAKLHTYITKLAKTPQDCYNQIQVFQQLSKQITMKTTSWRVIFFAGISALLIIYVVWWNRMIADPSEHHGIDFIALYSAGYIAQTHGFASIYDIELQQKTEQQVVGFELPEGRVLLYNHLPYIVPLLSLVVDDNYVGSLKRWTLVLTCIYLIGNLFFVKSLFMNQKAETQFMLFIGAFTFSPLFVSLWQGQDTAFLYLGVVFWCIGILKKQEWLVGVGLALATTRPHISIALAVPLLFRYRRALWRSVFLISGLAFLSFMLIRSQGTVEFLNLLRISSEGTWFGMKPEAMPNLLGFILRITQFSNPGTAALIGWVIYMAGIVLLGGLWLRSNLTTERLLGLSVLIAIVTAPHLHLHDLTLLIFPLLFVVHDRITMPYNPHWILLPLGASLFLIAGILLDIVNFILPYILFSILAWMLWYQDRTPASQEMQTLNRPL